MSALVLENQTADDVARAMIEGGGQKQAFYTFNMDEASSRIDHFRRIMPRVNIFYAMKSNDTDMMLRLAIASGVGFDCASPGEIYKVRKLGANPKKIIYAVTCKSPYEMKYARNTGVELTTFDSSCELKKLKESWADARLLIRIRIDGLAYKSLGFKFACNFETEAIPLLDQAASLGLNVVGVAFHVGSICYCAESYVLGLRRAKMLFDYEAKNGRNMNVLDIGGGFMSHKTDTINEVSCVINEALEELFTDPSVQVMAEPGRYLCDSAFTMYCSVVGQRTIFKNDKPIYMIYLNNGVNATMKYDENWHKLRKLQNKTLNSLWNKTNVQQTTDQTLTDVAIDQIQREREVKLPHCILNDWLVMETHGAYTLTFATKFSSLEAPLVRTVLSNDLWNRLKASNVFKPEDVVLNLDISTPLPSTLPPLITADRCED